MLITKFIISINASASKSTAMSTDDVDAACEAINYDLYVQEAIASFVQTLLEAREATAGLTVDVTER